MLLKKSISLLVAGVVTLSLITGCGTKNEEVSEQKEGTAQTEAVSVSEQGVLPIVDEPVSYTHLDVYKRQGLKMDFMSTMENAMI